MQIMELGAIGELVGGVAVVASLIFVGLQVRQSNRQAREDAAREIQGQYDRLFETVITDPKAREMWTVAIGGAIGGNLRNPANLAPDDLAVFVMLMARVWQQTENHYRAWQSGTLEDSQWAKLRPFIRIHLNSEPARDMWRWQREGSWHGKSFTDYVDNELNLIHAEEA